MILVWFDSWIDYVFKIENFFFYFCYVVRNFLNINSDEMSERGVDEWGEGLKGVFKVWGKIYDVYFDRNEIVWML